MWKTGVFVLLLGVIASGAIAAVVNCQDDWEWVSIFSIPRRFGVQS